MARVPLTFRQRDISAAIKAVERTGRSVARILIGKDGGIIVELAPPVGNGTAPEPEDPLDAWLEKHARKAEGNQPG